MAEWDLESRNLRQGNKSCILFIHGFQGDTKKTWGNFPEFLFANPHMEGWDVLSFGYQTDLAPNLTGIWEGDPDIRTIGLSLGAFARTELTPNYDALTVIGHSMGGLAVQSALVEDEAFRKKVDKVILFGTPSFGLKKAWLFRLLILKDLNKQVRDMAKGSKFLKDLRQKWDTLFEKAMPFGFLAVAGTTDEFVPQTASISGFQDELCEVVPGNHLEIVKPTTENDASLGVVVDFICGKRTHGSRYASSSLAIERRTFQELIDQLFNNRGRLDRQALVDLALALDAVGRRQDAIDALSGARLHGTDAMGVLAGRYKRNWLQSRIKDDAEAALDLYHKALGIAEKLNDAAQAFYHGINVAFLELIFRDNKPKAQEIAKGVLKHCTHAKEGESLENRMWRLATEGEAHLILEDIEAAVKSYSNLLAGPPKPQPWQFLSTSQQALKIADHLKDEEIAERLLRLFNGQ